MYQHLFSPILIFNCQKFDTFVHIGKLGFRAHMAISFSHCIKCCSCISCLLGPSPEGNTFTYSFWVSWQRWELRETKFSTIRKTLGGKRREKRPFLRLKTTKSLFHTISFKVCLAKLSRSCFWLLDLKSYFWKCLDDLLEVFLISRRASSQTQKCGF